MDFSNRTFNTIDKYLSSTHSLDEIHLYKGKANFIFDVSLVGNVLEFCFNMALETNFNREKKKNVIIDNITFRIVPYYENLHFFGGVSGSYISEDLIFYVGWIEYTDNKTSKYYSEIAKEITQGTEYKTVQIKDNAIFYYFVAD